MDANTQSGIGGSGIHIRDQWNPDASAIGRFHGSCDQPWCDMRCRRRGGLRSSRNANLNREEKGVRETDIPIWFGVEERHSALAAKPPRIMRRRGFVQLGRSRC